MSRVGRRVREGRPRGPTPSSTAATTAGSAAARSWRRDPLGSSSGPPGRDRGGPTARGDGVHGRHPVDLGVEDPLDVSDYVSFDL
jgi:hypothetical protein